MTEIASIKWLRVNSGLTQQQAAAAIGVSRETFNRWETGRIEIPAVKLARFQKVLASNTAFAPPVPTVAPTDPSKAMLRAEYDKLCALIDADTRGELPEEVFEKCDAARDVWYQAEYGTKALITRYEETIVSVLGDDHPRLDPESRLPGDVPPRLEPGNWLKYEVHHAETPAYKAFVKAYGLDLQ